MRNPHRKSAPHVPIAQTCSPPQSNSDFPWTPLSLDLPKLSCSLMMPKAGAPRALTTSLGCAWPRVLIHSKDDIRLVGFIAIRPNCTLGGHPKHVHSELVAHCTITGGRIAVHSKDAIRLAMLLALCPNFTLGGRPKAFIMDANKQTVCAPQAVSAHHMFRSHKHDSCRDRPLDSRGLPCSLAYPGSSCNLMTSAAWAPRGFATSLNCA